MSYILHFNECETVFFVCNMYNEMFVVLFSIIFYSRKLTLTMMDGFCQRISEKKWNNKRAILRKLCLHQCSNTYCSL